MLIAFLYCFSVLVVLGTSPAASASPLVSGFLREVVVLRAIETYCISEHWSLREEILRYHKGPMGTGIEFQKEEGKPSQVADTC